MKKRQHRLQLTQANNLILINMEKFKGTKGPWNYHQTIKGHYMINGSTWENFCKVYTISGSYADDPEQIEAEANAKLIAAAPLLLKACIFALENTDSELLGIILRNAISKATD